MDRQDEETFRDFAAGRSSAYARVAYLLTGDWDAADRLVRAALAASYRAWGRLRDHEDVDAFVYRALAAGVTDPWWRRSRPAPPPAPEGATDADRLRRGLLDLPGRQRAVVVLRHYEDVDELRTARLLGVSIATVRTLATRGLSRLRQAMDDPYAEFMRQEATA